MGREKQPNVSLGVMGENTSTAIEVGWSESHAALMRGINIWMAGVAPDVQLGLSVKITRRVGGVAAFVEVFRSGGPPFGPGPQIVLFPPY